MDAPAGAKIMYLLWILLMTFDLLSCVHSQDEGDVWFSLKNTTYQNNSCITLEDIGEGNDALLCRTNLTACCQSPALGNWFFPNGTRVMGATEWDLYRKRGKMVASLNRRRGGEEGIYYCEVPDSTNVTQTIYIGIYNAQSASFPEETIHSHTIGAITSTGIVPVCSNIQLTKYAPNDGPTTTTGIVPVRSSIQPTNYPPNDGPTTTTGIVPVCSKMQLTKYAPNDGPTTTTGIVPVCSSIQPTNYPPNGGRTTTTGTVPVSSIQPTNNPSNDGATTTSVITVAAVVIILVVIIVGVIILVVIFRAKKRKQLLVINKIQNVTIEEEHIEMKSKHEETTDQPPYAEILTKVPPQIPSKSEELVKYLKPSQNSTLTGEYNEVELESDDSKHALPAKPPRVVTPSGSMIEEVESSLVCQNVDQHQDPLNATNEQPRTCIYTVPDMTSSHAIETSNGNYDTVYSEPIQPSLFTDAVSSPSFREDLQPYAPIYTIPSNLPRSEEGPLKVLGSNIQEIHELGIGLFGKVILAKTVGLSPKDLRLSESDNNKSKSTLVAVKRLKSDAPNTTKDAFEKEVNFMSRLADRNVIRILGVCYEDTPFIMMEYMEKGDLNQYLQKFKTLSTTDSEPQGQITTSTLVHIATQIASAMKYLASHNFVHRDLATRNCLVGPNYLVKISDFGMSRSLYDSHYYRIHGRFTLPVRWMAFECFYGKFSQKSDVWAFGVMMWEIFTLAKEQPYNDMSDKQVVEDALKGKNRKTLARPDMCPLKVYKIMLECWEHNSDQRATFEELFQLLISFVLQSS